MDVKDARTLARPGRVLIGRPSSARVEFKHGFFPEKDGYPVADTHGFRFSIRVRSCVLLIAAPDCCS